MNKLLILLVLVVIIVAQYTFLSSFFAVSTTSMSFRTINASGTSAVIVAKVDYVSVRVKFEVIAEPGRTALIQFSDRSQINVTSSYIFEVFLPKTDAFVENFASTAPGEILLSKNKPVGFAVVANITDSYFTNTLSPDSSSMITLYWFKVQGNAHVGAHGFGVPV